MAVDQPSLMVKCYVFVMIMYNVSNCNQCTLIIYQGICNDNVSVYLQCIGVFAVYLHWQCISIFVMAMYQCICSNNVSVYLQLEGTPRAQTSVKAADQSPHVFVTPGTFGP